MTVDHQVELPTGDTLEGHVSHELIDTPHLTHHALIVARGEHICDAIKQNEWELANTDFKI